MYQVTIDYDKCTGALECVDVCPSEVYDEGDDGKAVVARMEDCTGCDSCVASCPEEAITVTEM